MADNVIADPGAAGATFATDDVGGVHFPRSKQVWGADGVATDVADGVAALPIQDGGNSITVDGAVSLAAALPAGTANIGDVDVLTVPAPLSTAGGGTEATALRVTLATDSTGLVSIDDNGASLTVDSPQLPAALAAGGGLKVEGVAGGVAVPVSGTITANAGSGTLAVSAAALPLPTGAATEATLASVKTAAELLDDTVKTDDAAFTPATDKVLMIGAQADETDPDAVDEGDAGALRMTLARGLHVNLRAAAGTEIGTSGAPVRTDPTGSTTQPVSGTVAVSSLPALVAGSANIGDVDVLTVPAPLSTAGGGTEAAALRVTIANDSTGVVSVDDNGASLTVDGTVAVSSLPALAAGANAIGTLAANSGVDIGDVTINNASGAAAVNIQDGGNSITVDGAVTLGAALPAGTNNIGDVDVLTLPGVAGDIAHDAADSGNPVKIGAKARTTDPTAAAANDRVDLMASTLGKLVVLPGATEDQIVSGTATFTNTTAADVIAAQGAGVKVAVTLIVITNAHATVGTKVEFRDATTVKGQPFAAALGGGAVIQNGGRPIFITAANAAATARNVTTGSDVDVFMSGYKTV